jgi:3-oxoacyl-[acyl-carrier protein] reductase
LDKSGSKFCEEEVSAILSGKVAIVTGSGRGIGKAIASAYAREGAAIVVTARTKIEIEATAAEIASAGGRVLALPTDVSRIEDVQQMVNRTLATFGQVDILVNNAGIPGPKGLITEVSESDWNQTLAINLTGAFLCCRTVVPSMIAAGGGNIINISSGAGHIRPRSAVRSLAYQVSKFGLEGLTHGLAVQLKEHKINVNSLLPGMILTRFHDQSSPEWVATMRNKLGKLEDVAEVALYLACQPPGEYTGQVVDVKKFDRAYRGSNPL